jgi:hypothetical protein
MILELDTDKFLAQFGMTQAEIDPKCLELAEAKLMEPEGSLSLAGGDVEFSWVNGVYTVKYHEIDAEEVVPLAQARWMLAIEYMG